MAKTESSFKNMVISLTLISLTAAAGLGMIYESTKGPIEQSVLNKKIEAIKQVVPEFNNNPYEEMLRVSTGAGDSLDVYPAKMNDNTVGYAITTYSKNGFSGDISLMVGFRADGSIHNIAVLEQKETPGLGTKMNEPFFKDQFKDKNPAETIIKVRKDGGQIDAITSATISSQAFCEAVQLAYNTLQEGGMK